MTASYACAAGGVVALAFVAFPETMVGVFTHDTGVIADGSMYLRAMAIVQITMGLEIVLEASLGGAGFTVLPMLWSGLFTAARIPLAAWLAGPFGVAGVWWALAVTAAARGIAMAALWRSERWERARV
jgi:Na+-driven multidrug efflux pump